MVDEVNLLCQRTYVREKRLFFALLAPAVWPYVNKKEKYFTFFLEVKISNLIFAPAKQIGVWRSW